MTADTEIKNCPFCGEKPTIHEIDYIGDTLVNEHVIICECGMETPSDKLEDLLKMWNRRA